MIYILCMIEEYKFGSITIDEKTYDYDVEVRWTGEILRWWRAVSHVIDTDDIKRALEQNPEIIIIGTGESGQAAVTDPLKEEVQARRIKLIVDLTEQAAKTFNIINEESIEEEGKQSRVIGLFHLTC